MHKDVMTRARIDFSIPGCTPEYPHAAMRSELEGVTRLAINLSDNGRIENVSVLKSSGHSVLDDAVKNQLLSGKCVGTPDTTNGKARSGKTLVEYIWKLKGLPPKNEKSDDNRLANLGSIATIDFAKNGCSPEYPRASLRNTEEGTTSLAVKVNEDGIIEDVKVTASSGFRGLDVAVAEKLRSRTCLANPAKNGGKNVDSIINVAYVWKLK